MCKINKEIDMRESRKVVQCECCKTYWEVEPGDVILLPWPRMVCPKCGHWIPLF